MVVQIHYESCRVGGAGKQNAANSRHAELQGTVDSLQGIRRSSLDAIQSTIVSDNDRLAEGDENTITRRATATPSLALTAGAPRLGYPPVIEQSLIDLPLREQTEFATVELSKARRMLSARLPNRDLGRRKREEGMVAAQRTNRLRRVTIRTHAISADWKTQPDENTSATFTIPPKLEAVLSVDCP